MESYSTINDRIYVGSFENCITVFDTDLNELSALNIGNPLDGLPKGIFINTECCPVTTPMVVDEAICYTGTPEKVFLQELIGCDGTVCEGTWTETTAHPNINFESCDLSVTVNGTGCATYTLAKNTQSAPQQCGAFDITVNVCATPPPSFTTTTQAGTCNETTPLNDAVIQLTNVIGDRAGISFGNQYLGDDYTDASNLDVSGGNGDFMNLQHTTTYTVRVWNGGNSCFTDETVTTTDVLCCPSTICLPIQISIRRGTNNG